MIYDWNFASHLDLFQYFIHAAFAVVVWDHLITLSDEVEYVWKREKSWCEFRGSSSQNDDLTTAQPSGFLSWCVFVGWSASGGR